MGMAAEETPRDELHNDAVSAPATLPKYPEMIMAAIKALGENGGSNKSSISRQIEATYGSLPPSHSALLTHHLNKMKSSGELHFLKNNYLIPDPNSPPPRGRGRPPKPKPPVAPGEVPLPPRPRGRPPKSGDDAADSKASTTPSVSGKKRGRPPKAAAPTPVAGGGAPRGRGRPPKVKADVSVPAPGA